MILRDFGLKFVVFLGVFGQVTSYQELRDEIKGDLSIITGLNSRKRVRTTFLLCFR